MLPPAIVPGEHPEKEAMTNKLLNQVLDIAIRAGHEILDVYEGDFGVDYKGDGSPLTIADQRSHDLIERDLRKMDSQIPVLSEESPAQVFKNRLGWERYWLVDPLDGTKEFVKRNGEFTVNIALIEGSRPVMGVVHTPVMNVSHFGASGAGAYRKTGAGPAKPISARQLQGNRVTMVASRSHSGVEVDQFRHNVEQDLGQVEITSMGSSLKICLVAEGAADIYPRLGPTSEWDTAAAHAVLAAAGGSLVDTGGQALQYNKPDILNPWFLACGAANVDWTQYLG
jgi:3'(2'), 5'-bisphosphate nucleotidase